MKHGASRDRRHLLLLAVAGLLAVGGASTLGVAVAQQESVPRVAGSAAAPTPSSPSAPSTPPPASSARPGRVPAPSGSQSPSAATSPAATEPAPPEGPVLPASKPASITIPSIDVTSPLLTLGRNDDGSLEVPDDFNRAGWYRPGPTPGEVGPAVIAGHVDSADAGPAVFFRLAELQPGATVLVAREDGRTAVFEVTHVAAYPKDAFPTIEVYGNIDHAGLRLITCGGSFDESIGHYRDNVVAYAHLIGVR